MKELRTTVESPLTKDLALDPGKGPRPPLPFPRECDRAARGRQIPNGIRSSSFGIGAGTKRGKVPFCIFQRTLEP